MSATPSAPALTEEGKNGMRLVIRMKETWGDDVWPGFKNADLPILLFTDSWSFLIGHPEPPESWEPVRGDIFDGRTYHFQAAENSQAFAVQVGDLWAGSLNTLDSINESMKAQLRERFPPEKLTPAFEKNFLFSPAMHAAALLHELFHAWQATLSPDRFERIQSLYVHEENYPYLNVEFVQDWNREGTLLLSALKEQDQEKLRNIVVEFLDLRDYRRQKVHLGPELLDFERELEWLEGLGKYAEIRFAELLSRSDDPEHKAYVIAYNRLRYDFNFRLQNAGGQKGDLRFYLTGSAMALLLDRLLPEWKDGFLTSGKSLEEQLRLARSVKG